VVFFIFVVFELFTSGYVFAIYEIPQFPAEDGVFYFFRDYGGFITSGLWGFFTLGALVLGDTYRGERIVTFDRIFTWKSADNSQVLLGEGIIALVITAIFIFTWLYSVRDAYMSHRKIQETGVIENAKDFVKRIWTEYFAYIIIIPAVILIIVFTLIPFLFSFLVAFTNWTGRIALSQQLIRWTFLDTFFNVFQNSEWLKFFFDVLGWTVLYAFMSSITVYVFGFIQALIIESKNVIWKSFWRAILILPWAIPSLISLMLFRNVFADNGGLMNQILVQFDLMEPVKVWLTDIGLVGQNDPGSILWLTSPQNGALAKVIVLIVNLWLGFPYFMMLITGVLVNRKYIGEFVYNRTTKKNLDGKRNNHQAKPESEIVRIPNGMPRIIDDDLFFKVQAILKKRKQNNFNPKARSKYLLTGTLQCAYCKRSVVGNLGHSGRNKTIRITYACKTKNPNRCQLKELNMGNLDRVVTEIISRSILVKENVDALTELTKNHQKEFIDNTKKRITEIGKEIDILDQEIDEIEASNTDRKKSIARVNYDQIKDKDIQIRDLEQERIALLGDLEVLRRPSKAIIENSIRSFKNSFYGKPLEVQKVTIKRLIRRIIISNEGVNILVNLKALMKIEKDVVGDVDYSIFVPRMSIVYPKRFPFQIQLKTETLP
jgi:ABC-type sugar transport system permease subunit